MMAVVYVDQAGVAHADRLPQAFGRKRQALEQKACSEILNRATPPVSCGPEIPVAPARGPMIAFAPRKMEITENGGLVRRHDGYLGRDAARVADAFDRMAQQALRAHGKRLKRAEAEGREASAFVQPFTPGQIAAARDYAALTERCAASGIKCSSLEAIRNQGSGGGDREVAVLQDLQRLRALHRRIGDGLAKELRRIRPGGNDKRRAIRVRYLVDQVCLSGLTLGEVLVSCGWAEDQKLREALRAALCRALDRMQGFDLL